MGIIAMNPSPLSVPACGTILLTMYVMVWDCRGLRAGPMIFYWPKFLDRFLSSIVFHFLFFLSIGWY